MILHLTYAYTAQVLGRGQRNPRSRNYLATVAVEIPEHTDAEAPVALRYASDRMDESPTDHVEFRWDGGRLLRAVAEPTYSPRQPTRPAPRTKEWLEQEAKEGFSGRHGLLSLAVDNRHGDPTGTLEQDVSVSKVKEHDREKREAEVRESASKVALVDGVVHKVGVEPVYRLSHPSWGDRSRTPYVFVEGFRPEDRVASGLFRADEAEYVRETYGAEVGEHAIEVILPEALKAPCAENALAEAGKEVRDALARDALKRDLDYIKVFVRVRDELARYDRALAASSPGDPPDAGALIEAMHAGVEAERSAGFAGRSDDWLKERVAKAVDRYDTSCRTSAASYLA